MTSQPFRDTLIEHLADAALVSDGMDGRSVLPAELREHLSRDEEALAEWRRLLAQAKAIGSLARSAAPADLDGRVVAAFHPGHRQDRIVASLRTLGRVAAPAGLESRVRHVAEQPFSFGDGKAAPPILDQLVEEEVADVRKSVSSRMVSRLEPRHAPEDLRHRVERTVDAGDGRRPSRLLPLVALMVSAGLAWNFVRGDGAARAGTRALDFDLVQVDSLEELRAGGSGADPLDLLDGMSGGAFRRGE